MAIANAVNRLRKSRVTSKAIVLLTDGEHNWGWISPTNAASLARSEGIVLFSIGVASYNESYESRIDDTLLRQISTTTGGRYFRAEDVSALRDAYSEIDRMEHTDLTDPGYAKYWELAPAFILSALGLYFIETVMKNTIFLTIP
jgi:Ca-activated chloride channel family protein